MRTRLYTLIAPLVLAATAFPLDAQIRVHPTGVNVATQHASTVFLTFGRTAGYEASEAFWCGALVSAAPAIGVRCAPGSIFGQLPLRYERATPSGTGALTDIMTIPASVARRAYQAAAAGSNSAFYYVRRFRSLIGGRDEFVAVTCRLAGNGARTPLALTDVRVAFADGAAVLAVAPGDVPTAFDATITYTGTGRLAGRWEVVRPGDALPSSDDLLTEATLPLERRAETRRHAQLSRFNVLLPPNGRIVLPGPDPSRLPTSADGIYYVLLRIEVSSEKEGDSDLAAVGAGTGVVNSGAVAGFPMPVLRYVVGSGESAGAGARADERSVDRDQRALVLMRPADGTRLGDRAPPVFLWQPHRQAAVYRLVIESPDGAPKHDALVRDPVSSYRLPPPVARTLAGETLRWRTLALDVLGREIARSRWRTVTLGSGDAPAPPSPPAR